MDAAAIEHHFVPIKHHITGMDAAAIEHHFVPIKHHITGMDAAAIERDMAERIRKMQQRNRKGGLA